MIARNSRIAALVSQTCQWEKRPTLIGNSPVALKSALTLQKARTIAITAAGVRSAASPSARCWFLRWLRRTLAPLVSRIRTIISGRILVYQAHTSYRREHAILYGKTQDRHYRHRLHGKSSR